MGIFDEKTTNSQSSLAELADLQKAHPDLTAAELPAPEPAAAPAPVSQPDVSRETQGGDADASEAETLPQTDDIRRVPLKALNEERNKRRQTEQQFSELKGRLDALQAMLQGATQGQQPPGQPQVEQAPDPDQDPIGALNYERQERQKLQQAFQSMVVQERVKADYAADVMRFRQTQSDFGDAYNYLLTSRYNELQAQGWNDQQIAQQVQAEEFNIALASLRANRSPAEAAYALAKARGYAPKSGPTTQAPTAAPPAKPAPDPVLDEAKRRAAASISEGGKAPKGELGLDDIAKLSGAAFDSAFEKFAAGQKKTASWLKH